MNKSREVGSGRGGRGNLRKERQEAINKKCELLIQMGFDIGHKDSSVYMRGIEFDFSAVNTDEKSILRHAIITAFETGEKVGREKLQCDLKDLLG